MSQSILSSVRDQNKAGRDCTPSSKQNTDTAAYKILVIKTEWIRPFSRPRDGWEDNTEKDINTFFNLLSGTYLPNSIYSYFHNHSHFHC